MSSIIDNGKQIILENSRTTIVISKKGCIAEEVRSGSKDLLSEKAPFFVLYSGEETLTADIKEMKSGTLTIASGNNTVDVKVEVKENFFTFTLLSPLPEGITRIDMASAKYSYDPADRQGVGANGLPLSCSVDPNFFPDSKACATKGTVKGHLESEGAKFAVVIAPIPEMRDILKEIYAQPDKKTLSSKMGGAFALDNRFNFSTCTIQQYISDEWMFEQYGFLSHTPSDIIFFYPTENTFLQGDFKLVHYQNTKELYDRVTKVFEKDGYSIGLHTRGFYIDVRCASILGDEKNREELAVQKTYTLKADMTDNFLSVDDATVGNTPFLLVDGEIMRAEVTEGGFKIVERALGSTASETHRKGAEVKALNGRFGNIMPVIGSDLFYLVARLTAKFYNEGGFKAIFIDTLESLRLYTADPWYYAARFVKELIDNCNITPSLELSGILPSVWPALSRGGGLDPCCLGFKARTRFQHEQNKKVTDMYLPATLGWYCFFPQEHCLPNDTNMRYNHTDDLDLMGTYAIAYDYSNYYNIRPFFIARSEGFRDSFEYYKKYDNVRKSRYFSEETLERIRNSPFEHKLIEKRGKRYSFIERHYDEKILENTIAPDGNIAEFYNPFRAQTPFFRLKNLLTTEKKNPLTLLPLDENRDLVSQTLKFKFPETLDLSRRIAKKVRVKGNGKKGGAICIRLHGKGFAEYFIDTDFEGWREFNLIEQHNGNRTDLDFYNAEKYGTDLQSSIRFGFKFQEVSSIEVLTQGDMAGVKMSSVVAYQHVYDILIDPWIRIGNTHVTFICELASTEFIEFDGKDAYIFDRYGKAKHVEPICYGEMLRAPHGKFEAKIDARDLTLNLFEEPRLKLTFGFNGKEIK